MTSYSLECKERRIKGTSRTRRKEVGKEIVRKKRLEAWTEERKRGREEATEGREVQWI